jgi:hypothetical protein
MKKRKEARMSKSEKSGYEAYTPERLKAAYERICQEYGNRLLDMYGFNKDYSWWVGDKAGSVFCINDCEFSLDMDDVAYLVDNQVEYEVFTAWWEHEITELERQSGGEPYELINLSSWCAGYHGKEGGEIDEPA